MKIRLLDDSVRFRISRDELDSLLKGLEIVAETAFPGNNLRCTVAPSNVATPEIRFEDHHLRLSIPHSFIDQMAPDDQVGFDYDLVFDNGMLAIKFEKDFKCLTDRDEKEDHLFENPLDKHPC